MAAVSTITCDAPGNDVESGPLISHVLGALGGQKGQFVVDAVGTLWYFEGAQMNLRFKRYASSGQRR